MFITPEMIAQRNQQALAFQLSARLERKHRARAAGLPSPLLDRIEAPLSMVAMNACAFIAECDDLGIESAPDYDISAQKAVLDEWRADYFNSCM